jgi:hypothetical protein
MTVRRSHHYGSPLRVAVKGGRLSIVIGVETLAYALKFASWAIRFDDVRNDYVQPYQVVDETELAKDVMHAMLHEREDGSSPLSDFLDAMTKAAIEDGSLGVDEDPEPENPYSAEKDDEPA